ncbi:MAG: hypothetical protein GF344_17110 [Chitinivibrionales bacterium]|nr:hypothetical protein [Chitinivibrionales bacterium]MBD3358402.1 hypothetical protein [Chitinivibrionales bacterium]
MKNIDLKRIGSLYGVFDDAVTVRFFSGIRGIWRTVVPHCADRKSAIRGGRDGTENGTLTARSEE